MVTTRLEGIVSRAIIQTVPRALIVLAVTRASLGSGETCAKTTVVCCVTGRCAIKMTAVAHVSVDIFFLKWTVNVLFVHNMDAKPALIILPVILASLAFGDQLVMNLVMPDVRDKCVLRTTVDVHVCQDTFPLKTRACDVRLTDV